MEGMFHSQFQRAVPDVSIADFSAMKQQNHESVNQFIVQLKKATHRCLVLLLEKIFAQFAFDGLNFTIRERMVGQIFFNLFSLATIAVKHENLLKEDMVDMM